MVATVSIVDNDFYFVALFPGSSIATSPVVTTDATTMELTSRGGAQLVPIHVNYVVTENQANNIIEWFLYAWLYCIRDTLVPQVALCRLLEIKKTI